MIEWGKILEALKLTSRQAPPVAGVVTGVLIFGPAWLLQRLGLADFVAANRGWIGFAFLVSIALVMFHVLAAGWARLAAAYAHMTAVSRGKRRLHDLTPEEKTILRRYVSGNTRTVKLPLSSGIASGLISAQIIYTSASIGDMLHGFAHNIQPWAWRYLKKHPSLLAEPVAAAAPGPARSLGDSPGRRSRR